MTYYNGRNRRGRRDPRTIGRELDELARRLPERCQIVFTTAYSDYACESYDVDATDYLMKPIDSDRFNRAVDKALTFAGMMAVAETPSPPVASASEEILTVKSDRRYVRLRVDEITFAEGLKDYLIIHTADRRVVTRMTVKSLEEALPPQFLRVGKSYIVNRDKIDSFDNNDLYIGSSVVPVGVSYKPEVLKILFGPAHLSESGAYTYRRPRVSDRHRR